MSAALDKRDVRPRRRRAADAKQPASLKERIETCWPPCSALIFLGLAVVVTVETVARKVFNVSLQGADELGGYALAVGSTIAFSLALMGRNHIRVDVFHETLLAAGAGAAELALASCRWRCSRVHRLGRLQGGRRHAAVPQHGADALGDAADLSAGRLVRRPGDLRAGGHRLRAARHVAAVHAAASTTLNHDFHPKSAKEELKEELDDLAVRQAAEGAQAMNVA